MPYHVRLYYKGTRLHGEYILNDYEILANTELERMRSNINTIETTNTSYTHKHLHHCEKNRRCVFDRDGRYTWFMVHYHALVKVSILFSL
jgi:hypothetical protein